MTPIDVAPSQQPLDFDRCLLETITSGEKHPNLPGNYVMIASLPSALVLTATQAVAVACRLLECAYTHHPTVNAELLAAVRAAVQMIDTNNIPGATSTLESALKDVAEDSPRTTPKVGTA
jgi:hypothetical protein